MVQWYIVADRLARCVFYCFADKAARTFVVGPCQGEDFLVCCEKDDYEVTVGGETCPIVGRMINNSITCSPSLEKPPTSLLDEDGGSPVQVSHQSCIVTC